MNVRLFTCEREGNGWCSSISSSSSGTSEQQNKAGHLGTTWSSWITATLLCRYKDFCVCDQCFNYSFYWHVGMKQSRKETKMQTFVIIFFGLSCMGQLFRKEQSLRYPLHKSTYRSNKTPCVSCPQRKHSLTFSSRLLFLFVFQKMEQADCLLKGFIYSLLNYYVELLCSVLVAVSGFTFRSCSWSNVKSLTGTSMSSRGVLSLFCPKE